MEIGRVNRDRSGRVPAASRSGFFITGATLMQTPSRDIQPEDYDFDPSEAVQHYDNPRVDDLERGRGY
jgi:hypothetical protein